MCPKRTSGSAIIYACMALILSLACAIDLYVSTNTYAQKQNKSSVYTLQQRLQSMSVAPFLHRPYYGDRHVTQRTHSYFDHDKPWYASDGTFVRFDGVRWQSGDTVTNCDQSVNCYDGHNGYDLNFYYETVLSAAAGTVIRAGWYNNLNHSSSFGLWVAIDHGNGYTTAYGHLSAISVTNGQQVGIQQKIATSGTTGASTGPHLHFGVYYYPAWQATDPFGWYGPGADPNTVSDRYLWVSHPGT